MKEKKHILVVDDDDRICKLLQRFLRESGYIVSTARNSIYAARLTEILEFDLLILDVMMPGEDGLSLTKKLQDKILTPIILLTARKEVSDRIKGLEAGADDYISKPFEPRELVLRMESIFKRMGTNSAIIDIPKTIKIGELQYDRAKNELWKKDELVPLTSAEKMLMEKMSESINTPVQREILAKKLFKDETSHELEKSKENNDLICHNRERGVDVNVNRLRKKIEPIPGIPRYLKTIRGIGYILVPD